MALTISYTEETAVSEYSYTAGTGSYALAGAWSTHLAFSDRYPAGATGLTYYVKDGSSGNGSQFEINTGNYDATAKTLTRGTPLASSNGDALVDWSGRTRLIVRPLLGTVTPGTSGLPPGTSGVPLCATPPQVGDVLVFDGTNYCPANLCDLVAACMNDSVGAVSFQGSAFLWNFPAMSDSPEGSMSVWLRVETSQIPNPGVYTPDVPDGDLNNQNLGYLIGGPPQTNFNSFFISVGQTEPFYGTDSSMRLVNPITNITSANPAVVTFTHPHGITAGSNILLLFINQMGWETLLSPFQNLTASSVTSTTMTIDFDTTGFPPYDYDQTMGAPNALVICQVCNSFGFLLENFPVTSGLSYRTSTRMASSAWVNLLASWKTDLAAGSKILNLYYGEVAVTPSGSFPPGALTNEGDIGGSFSVTFSTPSASEIDSWMVGGTLAPNEFSTNDPICVICDMAELWFAPGQYIDFTDPTNRAKFHDGSNKPVSLGADGSLPTGTPPVLYQSVPGIPTDPYAFLGLPLRFVNPQFNGASLAGSLMSSATFVCSFWVWGGGDHIVVHGSNGNRIEFDAIQGLVNVDLFDVSGTSEFNFTFPAPSAADVFNVALTVDTNHAIGMKLVTARVDNVSASVTVLVDNANSWLIDWTGPTGFAESNGFIADFWFGTNQFFDPLDKFMSAGSAWVDIGSDGSGANGAQPDVYLSVRGSGPASDLATNLGSAGALTQNGPFVLVPDGAVFLKNRSGNRNLLLNSGFTTFPLAPTHP